MTSCRTEQRLLVDHLIVIAAISQWYRRLSACVTAHGGHFDISGMLNCIHVTVRLILATVRLLLEQTAVIHQLVYETQPLLATLGRG